MADASIPDLLRLLCVPALGWAAVRDVRTRRVSNRLWPPLAILAVGLLAWDAWTVFGGPSTAFGRRLFLIRVLVSLGIVAPTAYLLWRLGGFGGADAKAFVVLALLFPTYPAYELAGTAYPLVETRLGVFSLTVLTNTVLLGLAYPLVLLARNLAAGRASVAAVVGVPVHWRDLETTHGRLLETPGGLTRGGLDLDALRMYLRWRGTTLADLRAAPDPSDPATLPPEPGDPTDGAVATDGGVPPAGDTSEDPWGAAAFLDALDGSAYGTSPDQLRAGLALVADPGRERVWVSPGIPFLVPTLAGLLVALGYGDLLATALRAVGLA